MDGVTVPPLLRIEFLVYSEIKMTTPPIISPDKFITVVAGSVGHVKRKLNKIPDGDVLKIIVIVFLESDNVPVLQIARAFKKSASVNCLLSGEAEYELYKSIIAASLPKKFPKPKLMIQAEVLAASKS